MASHAPNAGGCLGDETIAAMLEGGLSADAAGRARAHMAGCAACRRLVSAAIEVDAPGSFGAGSTMSAGSVEGARTLRDPIAPGTVIAGRYRIERVLGEGGMGRVFVARQLGLERLVAIKILRPELARDRVALQRFDREARLVASLISEQVVRVHDSGELATGEPYLVMELLEGEDLATVLARGPISIAQAVGWILETCEALGEAHALGIVHRDIKPSNLFVTRAGRLKVLDFGLAKLAAPAAVSMTAAGVVLGSPRYMAPEQITGARDVDARADIWSLGATLYHLVTGQPPFAEPTLEAIFARILGGAMPPLDGVPPPIAAVILRALSRDPAARFATVGEFAAALRVPLRPLDERSEAAGGEAPRGIDVRFEVIEVLGQGGYSTVYRARQRQGGREVALKVFHPDVARGHDRFAREAAIVERLEHPNTVRLYEHGLGPDGAPFLVFELVRGRTLDAELDRGPLAPARVARIAAQVLKALMEAHALGIVHRDIKPENILLVDHAGEPDFVKLLDFGISTDAESQRLTTTGQLVGTPLYTAPERIAGGPIDPRSDLYALGLVMAEAITGRPVFDGESFMAVCAQHASPAPAPLAREVVASSLGAVIARAVVKQPAGRYATARDMLAAIEAAPAAPRRSSRAPILVAAVAVVVAAISIAVVATRDREVAAPSGSAGTVIGSTGQGETIIGSRGEGETVIGSRKPGVTIIGPIVQGSDAEAATEPAPRPRPATRPPAAPARPSARGGDGVLGNLDESRLRGRIVRLGWTVKEVSREDFPGCRHTRFQIERLDGKERRWGDVTLLECDSRMSAAGEGARLRHGFPNNWIVDDGTLVLLVATPEPGGSFATERGSKQLYDALLVP